MLNLILLAFSVSCVGLFLGITVYYNICDEIKLEDKNG